MLSTALSSDRLEATLIAAEDFVSYGIGSQLNGQSGGTGWTGNWVANTGATPASASTIVSGGLSYQNGAVKVSGGDRALQILTANNSIDVFARRSIPTQTDTVYLSFLLQKSANFGNTSDFLQTGFSAGTGEPLASALESNSSNIAVRRGTSGAGGNTVNTGSTLPVGTTRFIVLKVENLDALGNYDRASVAVDPTSYSSFAANPITEANFSGGTFSSITNFTLRRAFQEAGDSYLMDRIRIGTTFNDVVPVPEPSTTLVLLGLFGASLARRKRRLVSRS